MNDYTEHIDGVLARIEAQWPDIHVVRIGEVYIHANNPQDLIDAIIRHEKRRRKPDGE